MAKKYMSGEIPEGYGSRIRELREQRNMSREELAETVGSTYRGIYDKERGDGLFTGIQYVFLHKELGIDLNWLITGENANKQRVKTICSQADLATKMEIFSYLDEYFKRLLS